MCVFFFFFGWVGSREKEEVLEAFGLRVLVCVFLVNAAGCSVSDDAGKEVGQMERRVQDMKHGLDAASLPPNLDCS